MRDFVQLAPEGRRCLAGQAGLYWPALVSQKLTRSLFRHTLLGACRLDAIACVSGIKGQYQGHLAVIKD